EADGSCQIIVRFLRPVNQSKTMISLSAHFQSMRKTVMHGSYIVEPSAGIHNSKRLPWFSPEIKKSCIFSGGLLLHLFVRINRIKYLMSFLDLMFQIVQDFHCFFCPDI